MGEQPNHFLQSHKLLNPLLYGFNQIQHLENNYMSSPKPYEMILSYGE